MNLRRIQRNFDALAASDPLWTVLADPNKRGRKWDPEDFYETGEAEIAALEHKLANLGLRLEGKRALDFGCGVGRTTFPLAHRFETCLGIDISSCMIKEAQANAARGVNCSFILNTESKLPMLADASIDFAYSNLVFQHLTRHYVNGYIREIARSLAPGGLFVFQMPSTLNPDAPDNQRPLRLLRKRLHYLYLSLKQTFGQAEPYFEMTGYPSDRLIRYVHRHTTLRLIASWDYPVAGPNWRSHLYLFTKSLSSRPSQTLPEESTGRAEDPGHGEKGENDHADGPRRRNVQPQG